MQEINGMRVSDTGATRNSARNKLQYSKYSHPLCEFSFAEYMLGHQYIGGERREGDNWQLGLGEDTLFESLVRHVRCLELLMAGYYILEYKLQGKTNWFVTRRQEEIDDKIIMTEGNATDIHLHSKVDTLNSIRFNSEGLKHFYLTAGDAKHGTEQDIQGGEVSEQEECGIQEEACKEICEKEDCCEKF